MFLLGVAVGLCLGPLTSLQSYALSMTLAGLDGKNSLLLDEHVI